MRSLTGPAGPAAPARLRSFVVHEHNNVIKLQIYIFTMNFSDDKLRFAK
jgi:hypothetical protein